MAMEKSWRWGSRSTIEVEVFRGETLRICAAHAGSRLAAYLSAENADLLLGGDKGALELCSDSLELSVVIPEPDGTHYIAKIQLEAGGPSRDEIAAVIREAVATIRSNQPPARPAEVEQEA